MELSITFNSFAFAFIVLAFVIRIDVIRSMIDNFTFEDIVLFIKLI